ncbi:MAG TPA: biopolymer transporter Tol, partial [Verrucomicrobiae bacterium]|nr:biopolymer transporter Tol [Verrucomicrobiae bacterium]
DHVLSGFHEETAQHEMNLRNVGVSVPGQAVRVSRNHPRNHDGTFFSVLVTRTVADPVPGSDQINRACEEGWVGTNGYIRADGKRQRHALAFQGQVLTARQETISEVFIADLPEDVRLEGDGPLAGTATRRPLPPRNTVQRRLTFTADRKFPGLQGARHWLRCSPDGSRIAFLMKDDDGVVQLWTVSPTGGQGTQLTHNRESISSTFTWSPDGRFIAHTLDNSVCVTLAGTGETKRLTDRCDDASAPRPEACVFGPDGKQIAYVRPVRLGDTFFNEIFVVALPN